MDSCASTALLAGSGSLTPRSSDPLLPPAGPAAPPLRSAFISSSSRALSFFKRVMSFRRSRISLSCVHGYDGGRA